MSTKPRAVVLIVTADSCLSAVASRVLQRNGYEVLTAPHAGHAILAGLTSDRIDTVIAELHLDDMSGTALAATLRRYHPELRSLFLAQHDTPEQNQTLVRPFTSDELLQKMDASVTAVSPAS
jgi:DNA-binding response OmpR family regulator